MITDVNTNQMAQAISEKLIHIVSATRYFLNILYSKPTAIKVT